MAKVRSLTRETNTILEGNRLPIAHLSKLIHVRPRDSIETYKLFYVIIGRRYNETKLTR